MLTPDGSTVSDTPAKLPAGIRVREKSGLQPCKHSFCLSFSGGQLCQQLWPLAPNALALHMNSRSNTHVAFHLDRHTVCRIFCPCCRRLPALPCMSCLSHLGYYICLSASYERVGMGFAYTVCAQRPHQPIGCRESISPISVEQQERALPCGNALLYFEAITD